MAEVSLKNVSKSFGSTEVLRDINLALEQGEFVVFVGPSGCGKSTTLRLIAGLEEVTAGEIEIAGRVVNNLEPKDRDIAMVFQSYALYPHMTVAGNISYPLRKRKVPKDEQKELVRKTAELLQLTELLHRKPRQLSGGQQQRVALGRALVRDPKVFLLDEPLHVFGVFEDLQRMHPDPRVSVGKRFDEWARIQTVGTAVRPKKVQIDRGDTGWRREPEPVTSGQRRPGSRPQGAQ